MLNDPKILVEDITSRSQAVSKKSHFNPLRTGNPCMGTLANR